MVCPHMNREESISRKSEYEKNGMTIMRVYTYSISGKSQPSLSSDTIRKNWHEPVKYR